MRDFLQGLLDKIYPPEPIAPPIPPTHEELVMASLKEKLYQQSLIPPTREELSITNLKNELYEEYNTLVEVLPKLTSTQKYELAKLTRMPEWTGTFNYLLDRYKSILFSKGTRHGDSKDDLLVMKAQIKNVTVFKLFHQRFKNVPIPADSLTNDSPETTIDLDDR